MSIDHLELVGAAKSGAQALLVKFPEIVFTSGRRGVADQARAMASNVIKNRQWIAGTYVDTAESRALQHWIDAHPQAVTQGAIAAGLEQVMPPWSDTQRANVSKLFSGQAFDVQPVAGSRGAEIKTAIRAPG